MSMPGASTDLLTVISHRKVSRRTRSWALSCCALADCCISLRSVPRIAVITSRWTQQGVSRLFSGVPASQQTSGSMQYIQQSHSPHNPDLRMHAPYTSSSTLHKYRRPNACNSSSVSLEAWRQYNRMQETVKPADSVLCYEI